MAVYTKEQIIENARKEKWPKGGYKTVEDFIAEINGIDDKLFKEWFELKPGDKFLGRPGNSWGHGPKDKFVELEFKSHGDWEFPNGHVGHFKTDYMEWTFITMFGGKIK